MKILKPFDGFEYFKLYSSYNEIEEYLIHEKVIFTKEIWNNSDCTIPYNWIIIKFDYVMLFFSEGNYKLFKIIVLSNNEVTLPNGINFATSIEEAMKIDKNLYYNEFDEIYESKNGYWIEEDMKTKTIASLSIFVKEINDEKFDECNW